jgi:hypothetical protein
VLAGTPILVSVARGEMRAAVRRDADGHLWIAHWTAESPDRVAGTRLEGLRPAQISGPGCSAVGARLPAAARSVEVRDDDGTWRPAAVGDGAWVTFVRRDDVAVGLPPVRLRGADGALVFRADPRWMASSRPLARHERLGPAGIGPLCPACGADDWRAAPSGSGAGEHVFCGVCGHDDGAVRAFLTATNER